MARVPQDLLDRIRRLEREVRELRGRSQIRPAMDEISHGDVRIGEGGSLHVYPPGHVPGEDASVFTVGEWVSGEGVTSYGTALRREDGSPALAVGGNVVGAHQMVRVFPSGNDASPIMMDDAFADDYLGRPWVPIPMQAGKDFSGSSWSTTHIGKIWCQHAVLVAYWSVFTSASDAVYARLMIDDGSGLRQIGDTITSSNGDESYAVVRFSPSEHGLKRGDIATVQLQGRSSGSNSGTVWARGMWGDNAGTPDEAN